MAFQEEDAFPSHRDFRSTMQITCLPRTGTGLGKARALGDKDIGKMPTRVAAPPKKDHSRPTSIATVHNPNLRLCTRCAYASLRRRRPITAAYFSEKPSSRFRKRKLDSIFPKK
mmetsp:Transcript_4962/g.14208  ORF Transcript_4962/g.14208 Transcript_4962/m.14208 type:complete len:114 (-) Transcript_4962:175-516(-)